MELISDLEREEFEEKSRRRFRRILLFAVGLGFLIFFLVLSWALMYGGGISFSTGLLGVHSCYMVFYLLFLHSLSSTMYRFLPTTIHYSVQIIHGGIHFIAGIGAGIGLAAIIVLHAHQNPPNHFQSLHSWVGIATLGIYYIQFLGSFPILMMELPPKGLRTWFLSFHRMVGQFVLLLSSASVLTGLLNGTRIKSTKSGFPAEMLLNSAAVLTVVYAFTIGYLLTDFAFRRPIYSEEEVLLSRDQLARAYSGQSSRNPMRKVLRF